MPVQLYAKLTIHKGRDGYRMNIPKETEVEQLKEKKGELFDQDEEPVPPSRLNTDIILVLFKNIRLLLDKLICICYIIKVIESNIILVYPQ